MSAALGSAADKMVNAIERVRDCVVTLHVGQRFRGALGSGFFISPDGHLLTNAHVVGNAPTLAITLPNGTQCQGAVVDRDKALDLALVKADVSNVPVVRVADTTRLKAGMTVFTVGSPAGLADTVTDGIISGFRGPAQGRELIQTNAALNPGSSGGPLALEDGDIIGVNTMIVDQTEGIGFAVPIEQAFPMLQRQGVAFSSVWDNAAVSKPPDLSAAPARPPGGMAPMVPQEHSTLVWALVWLLVLLCLIGGGLTLAAVILRRRARRTHDVDITFH